MNRLPVPVRFATTLLMLTLSALAVESGWPSATAGADDEDPYACGGEGEPRCAIDSLFAIENNFLKRCDRGLRSEDGICVNDTRYQLTAQLFQHTWAYWALNNQRRDLAGLQPLDTVMLLGAHNAYNNDADGYIHPNQEYSITDQLRAGIRVVDLDIHLDDDALLTGILPMLCHSSMASHLGCSRFDRWLVSAVKEIRHWMLQPENAIEVVVILLEDYVDEGMSTALINVPFQRFLADEPGIGVLTPDVLEHFQDTENTDHFPSQHWLVTHGKRVAILAQNDGFGDHLVIKRVRGQNSHRTFGTEINEFVPYPDCQLGTETHIATDPDGPMFAEVFGDQLEGGAERNLTASDVEELARCNVDFINMDDVLVDRGGGVEAPMKNAVWSWEEGDRGLGGDGAMRVAATGRWQSRPTDELHRFLCRRDDGGWVVTPGMGPWTHGWAACRTEFPDATFSVPVNGWQSERVTEERFPDDLWMNYHVVGDSDRWHINHAPDVQLAGPLASGEGAPVAFVPAVHDPDGTKIVAYAWDFGDGTTITTPEDGPIAHAFAEEGVYTVKLTATDELGASGEGQTTVDVGNTAPEVTAATDLTAVEGIAFGPITVAMFEDAGAMDTFEATIDWGDGVHRPAMASAPTVVGGFTYFDDGRFTIEVCVMDDDGGRGCATSTVAVSNTPPEASIDRSATVDIDGEPTLVGGRGSALGVRAMASDIGTDDLVFVWTLMDADETSEAPARVAAYYNDGAEPDPPLSLTGSHPLEATDGFNLAVPDLGPHRLRLGVVDDDGGSVSDHLSVLIVGDVSCTRSEAAWRRRFGNGRRAPTDPDRLTAYMAVVRRASATFDEANLADIEDAQALFREGGGPDSARSLRQRTLAAWLNFASGGVGWYEDVAGRTFHDIVLDAEALLAAGGPQGQLSRAVQAVDAVNRLHRGGVCDGE